MGPSVSLLHGLLRLGMRGGNLRLNGPRAGLIFNPPLTSFDTLSDSFAKQLTVPPAPPPRPAAQGAGAAEDSPGEDGALNLGTPDCVDLPITVMNRVLLLRGLRQRPSEGAAL